MKNSLFLTWAGKTSEISGKSTRIHLTNNDPGFQIPDSGFRISGSKWGFQGFGVRSEGVRGRTWAGETLEISGKAKRIHPLPTSTRFTLPDLAQVEGQSVRERARVCVCVVAVWILASGFGLGVRVLGVKVQGLEGYG